MSIVLPSDTAVPQQVEEVSNAEKHPSGHVPTLQYVIYILFVHIIGPNHHRNVVSTANLGCLLELKRIVQGAKNTEYNPKRFAAVIMRIREPKATALIFASGKMVCTGAKTEDESLIAARKFARVIQRLEFPVKFRDFKIQNIVGSCDVRFAIRLEGLSHAHNKLAHVSYY